MPDEHSHLSQMAIDSRPTSEFDADAKVMLGRLIGLVETFPLRFDRIEANAVAERASMERRLSTVEEGLGKVKNKQYWLTGAHAAAGVFIGFIAAHWQSFWKP